MPHHDVAGRALLEERVRQLEQVLEELERHLQRRCTCAGAAADGCAASRTGNGTTPPCSSRGRDHAEQVAVLARHDLVDRHAHHAPASRARAAAAAATRPGCAASSRARRRSSARSARSAVLGRRSSATNSLPGSNTSATPVNMLADRRAWRSRAADGRDRPCGRSSRCTDSSTTKWFISQCRIVPAGRNAELLRLDLHAARAQAERARALEDAGARSRRCARRRRLPHLFDRQALAVVLEHHRQARRAAIGRRELQYDGHLGASQPAPDA